MATPPGSLVVPALTRMATKTKASQAPAKGEPAPTRGRGDGGHRLATAFEDIETFPALAESKRRLNRLISAPNPAETEIVDIIESDVGLALVVMRAANN